MTIHPYGDSAILINFEQKIDEKINAEVIALHHAIQNAAISGITFYIPAYCSLTIGYDTDRINYDQLHQQIETIAQHIPGNLNEKKVRTLDIPVCYDAVFALDIDDVINETELSKKDIISLHTNTIFRVFMLGFLPGFAYMGKLPETLYCPRKVKPRLSVPSRAVGLAGHQTGIYPSEAPGGWQIIGKTPLKLFDPEKEIPFLFQPGDRVKFRPVSLTSFQHIENDVASGNFNIDSSYG